VLCRQLLYGALRDIWQRLSLTPQSFAAAADSAQAHGSERVDARLLSVLFGIACRHLMPVADAIAAAAAAGSASASTAASADSKQPSASERKSSAAAAALPELIEFVRSMALVGLSSRDPFLCKQSVNLLEQRCSLLLRSGTLCPVTSWPAEPQFRAARCIWQARRRPLAQRLPQLIGT
jgi:hypothetical protein